ncbi:MAG: sensor histidine kinase [Terriglobales bacterium]
MATAFSARTYWTCQILGWVLYVLFGLLFVVVFPPGPPFWRFLVVYLIGAGIAILITHAYRRLVLHRRPWLRLGLISLFGRIVLASIVLGILITIPMTGVYLLMFTHAFVISSGLTWILPALWVWIGSSFVWNLLYAGTHYFLHFRRAEFERLQLEIAARDAELRALLAQLNPHFLFNSLNSLRALISEDPPRAQALLTDLSELLRYSLTAGRRTTVTLAEELEAVSAYLKLEAARLEERLHVETQTDPAALSLSLPPMLLQTLVENAVKHGIAQRLEGGTLRIAATRQAGQLRLEVENSGQLSSSSSSTRLGLENARERLRLLYGEAAHLAVHNQGPDSVLAEVVLPAPGQKAAPAV